ncbi:MAG: hypothetical protein PVSMB8_05010 [Vulcanimicrobiaceae bacterium]
MFRATLSAIVMASLLSLSAQAATVPGLNRMPHGLTSSSGDDEVSSACGLSETSVQRIQNTLTAVVNIPGKPGSSGNNGGLFRPNRMWSAVVDRAGRVCSVIKTGDAWPGSRAIALAKAFTANGFSNDALALSTTMLFASTQPNGSLWGLNESNPFNPAFLADGKGLGKVAGGIITFGGGVALYEGGKVVGGLGLSGDTSCADHVIAYRMRRMSGFDGIPGGKGSDNISYPTAGNAPTGFQQPHCFVGVDLDPGSI